MKVLDRIKSTAPVQPEALAFHKHVTDEQVRVLYRGTDKTAYRA